MNIPFISLFLLLMTLSCSQRGPDKKLIYPGEVIFESPMTVVNQIEAEMIRSRIMKGIEPQASAFETLLKDANLALNFQPDPPKHMNIMGGYEANSNLDDMRGVMDRESMAAYSTALAWLYSGEEKYAVKSAEVLRTWAQKGTKFDGNDAGLQIGSWFNRILYAADILKGYCGWKPGRPLYHLEPGGFGTLMVILI